MAETKKVGIQVQSVARAVEILRCFLHEPELGISEIAAEMQLNKSTVFGLVNTLTHFGFLEQVDSNKKYRLGAALFELGSLVVSRIDIQAEAKSLCAPLVEKYPATLHMAVHSEGEILYISKLNSENSIINTSNVGRRAPMHCTGVGKAILAYLPESYIDRYLRFPLKRLTARTITEREHLMAELDEVRRTGIAVDAEEVEPGLNCIAAPVLRQNGIPELAISLSFPYGRLRDVDAEAVKRDLLACTRVLSAKLGYR